MGTADFLTSLNAAVFALAWGYAADRYSRVRLLSYAAALWGLWHLDQRCTQCAIMHCQCIAHTVSGTSQ